MIGLNCVMMVGEVADFRPTPGGKVLNLKIKVTESYVTQDGEVRQKNGNFKVVVFGQAKVTWLSGAINVGSTISVLGKLENKSWDDKQGVKHWETQINASEVTPLGQAPEAPAQTQHQSDEMPF